MSFPDTPTALPARSRASPFCSGTFTGTEFAGFRFCRSFACAVNSFLALVSLGALVGIWLA